MHIHRNHGHDTTLFMDVRIMLHTNHGLSQINHGHMIDTNHGHDHKSCTHTNHGRTYNVTHMLRIHMLNHGHTK